MNVVTRTGLLNNQERMPIEFEYINAKDLDSNDLGLSGIKIFGTVEQDKLPMYDSVAPQGTEELQRTLLKSVQGFTSQIVLPTRKMSIGDTIMQQMPLTMNMAGVNVVMDYTQIYKLISTTPTTANFSIEVNFTLNMNVEKLPDMPMTGGGVGKGTMVFDRINEHPLNYDLSYTMNITAANEGVPFDASMTMHSNQNISITKK